MPRGYDRPLYLLPFDHRGSFATKMFGWEGALSAEQTALLKTFREEFIAVTPGEGKFPRSFKMGEDGTTRDVTLTRKFSIAKYEVPQNLWEAVMGSNPSKCTKHQWCILSFHLTCRRW